MSTEEPKQQTRTVVITALISAVSTIAVSFIAALPVMLKADAPAKTEAPKEIQAAVKPGWRISGRVLDEATDIPVSAQLFLSEAGRETTTDDEGRFVFQNVAPGDYWVHVAAPGTQTTKRYRIGPPAAAGHKSPAGGGPALAYTICAGPCE